MQLALTTSGTTVLNALNAVAHHIPTAKRIAGTAALTIGAIALDVINWAAPRAIAAGIEARRFYDEHLHHHVVDAFYAVAFWSLVSMVAIASAVLSLYRVAAPVVRQQWVIQVADFRAFHAAVSGGEVKRADRIAAEIDAIICEAKAIKSNLQS